jgi:predicted Zn-dependent protease
VTTPQGLVDAALEASTADDCVVVLRTSSTANVRWANNTLTTNGITSSTRVTVVSIVDGSVGRAAGVLSRSATTKASVRQLVRDADAAARAAGPADDAAPLIPGTEAADFGLEPGSTSIDAFTGFAADLGESFRQAASNDHLLYGYAEHDVTTTYVASTTGLRLRHEQPTAQFGMTGKPTDLSTSAWVGRAGEQLGEIDVPALSLELTKRIGWGSRRIDLPAGRHQTVLSPTAVADLLIYLYFVSSGRDAFEGRTVFSDLESGTKVGKQVASPGVRVFSDPHLAGLAAEPFVAATASNSTQSVFDNGAALASTDWISDGVLRNLVTSRYTAQLTGLPFTPAIDNLSLTVGGGSGTVDDLVASSDRALLVTCLWYIREVDPHTLLLTGLTRDGVYLVEGGEVVGAVNNFRFNESPVDLLNRFTQAGATQRSYSREWGDYVPRTATPALRIPDFNMSTVSQAS